MCVALIGGMDRLRNHYVYEADRYGIKLKVFNRYVAGMESKIKNADAIVIFTNKVSHKAREVAVKISKTKTIPLVMCNSCGICTLRDCLGSLTA